MSTKIRPLSFMIALSMMITLTFSSTMISGQGKADNQPINSSADNAGNDLVGVWEVETPALNDCETGEPIPPIIRVMYMFNQGGTMTLEDTLPFEGPYRTTGGGVWKRTSGRDYTYVNQHYSFDPVTRELIGIVKVRSNVTLSQDANSFTEKGTVEVSDANGNVVFNGCFSSPPVHRLTF